ALVAAACDQPVPLCQHTADRTSPLVVAGLGLIIGDAQELGVGRVEKGHGARRLPLVPATLAQKTATYVTARKTQGSTGCLESSRWCGEALGCPQQVQQHSREAPMDRIWLKNYPPGVPADIDPARYRSVIELFEAAFANYRSSEAFVCMGKSLTYGQ